MYVECQCPLHGAVERRRVELGGGWAFSTAYLHAGDKISFRVLDLKYIFPFFLTFSNFKHNHTCHEQVLLKVKMDSVQRFVESFLAAVCFIWDVSILTCFTGQVRLFFFSFL